MKIFLIVILIVLVAVGAYFLLDKDDTALEDGGIQYAGTQYKDLVRVDSPFADAVIENPVIISGEARGNWYFEASFPVEILDEDGTSLGIAPIQASGEWMTTEYVPFSGTVTFREPTGKEGTIVFHKDNPSGLAEFDDSFAIPVKFK